MKSVAIWILESLSAVSETKRVRGFFRFSNSPLALLLTSFILIHASPVRRCGKAHNYRHTNVRKRGKVGRHGQFWRPISPFGLIDYCGCDSAMRRRSARTDADEHPVKDALSYLSAAGSRNWRAFD